MRLQTKILNGVKILASNVRKLLIRTPVSLGYGNRLRIVNGAASKIAEKLGLNVEVTDTDKVLSPYVFYMKGDAEAVPVYCDLGKDWDEERIYDSIRSVVYALSFLPQHEDLHPIRGS